jgi:uncharacterized membrane protein
MIIINLIVQILNIIKIFLNHLVNIPLNLLAGVGKFYAVLIAFCLDMLQATIYTKILEEVNFSKKLSFILKILPDEKTIESKPFFNKFRKLQYLGIFLLASLPVYTGGICAAATLRYVSSNLNKKKSLFAMIAGSLLGCIIWVNGINFIFLGIKVILQKVFI